jgi:hypothetical protein
MGYEISAFAVADEAIHAFVGKGNREVLERVLTQGANAIARRDRLFARPERPTPITDALTELCHGTVVDAVAEGSRYGYALQVVCQALGEWLGPQNIRLSPQGLGATRELSYLFRSKPPVQVPEPRDFPRTAFLPREVVEVRATRGAGLAANPAEWAEVPRWLDWPAAGLDYERAIYLQWMRRGAALGRSLWFFYH